MTNRIVIVLIITATLLLGCRQRPKPKEISINEPEKVKIFNNYNFNTGDFSLYAIYWECGPVSKLNDSLGIFYIDNISKLNELKTNWDLIENNEFYACGFDYVFYLKHKNQIIQQFYLNIECKSLITNNKAYLFELENLNIFKTEIKRLEKIEFKKPDKKQALIKIGDYMNDSSIFIPWDRFINLITNDSSENSKNEKKEINVAVYKLLK